MFLRTIQPTTCGVFEIWTNELKSFSRFILILSFARISFKDSTNVSKWIGFFLYKTSRNTNYCLSKGKWFLYQRWSAWIVLLGKDKSSIGGNFLWMLCLRLRSWFLFYHNCFCILAIFLNALYKLQFLWYINKIINTYGVSNTKRMWYKLTTKKTSIISLHVPTYWWRILKLIFSWKIKS
jgi:hypothetical protein